MKQKVRFSILSQAITAIFFILFIAGVISLWDNTEKLIEFSVIMGGIAIAGLYFCPVSVEATGSEIVLHRLLAKPKVFAYKDIQAVETFYPTAGGLRLCGSGGFFGYWGYFSDIMIGSYFGYYGSRDCCFLLRLKTGTQYVLGCTNPASIIACITSKMKQ